MIVRKLSVVGMGVESITPPDSPEEVEKERKQREEKVEKKEKHKKVKKEEKERMINEDEEEEEMSNRNGHASVPSQKRTLPTKLSGSIPVSPPSPSLLTRSRHTISPRDECLMVMVVCNTVQVETASDGTIKYLTI